MRATSWTWRFEDTEGRPVEDERAAAAVFPTQADAEAWIGEVWRGLREQGVEVARLFADGTEVYGPVSLRVAD
ncbi:hypothetical protein [Kineococcus terrestris]|uniref:hypothetical protein n=1 Tax=Kineococcus terrestris TaxID=2044856 RepID=UPI0034DB2043